MCARPLTTWTGNRGPGTVDYAGYERALETVALGWPAILGSSDPASGATATTPSAR